MNIFTTANRGLCAAFIINGHEPLKGVLNDKGKPALEFEKTDALMAIHKAWGDDHIVGSLPKFSDAMYRVYLELRKVAV